MTETIVTGDYDVNGTDSALWLWRKELGMGMGGYLKLYCTVIYVKLDFSFKQQMQDCCLKVFTFCDNFQST